MSRKSKASRKAKAPPPHPSPGHPFSNQQNWFFGLFLVLAVIVAYQPVWHAGFIWDDDIYVTNNPLLTLPDGQRRIWFSQDSPSQYFPLTYTIFRMEHALWGFASTGYHWVNILLHAANALLVWQVLQRLKVPGAALAAAIFALHPVQVEAVAWVTELKSVLSLFFILLTLLAWLEFNDGESRPSWPWYLLALISYALALAAKTTACTLGPALFLILWLQHKPINWPRLAQIVPFLLMGVGMGLLAMWWERYHQGTQGALFALSLPERLLVASHALWFYLGKLILPINLMFSYPRWTLNPSNPLAYGWLVAAAGLGVAIFLLRRWHFAGRGPETAALFYVLTLSPLLGFIMLYTFLYTFVADHYHYVACIGPIALVAAGITRAFEMWGKGKLLLKWVLCGTLLLTLAMLTWQQCRMYRNEETLWRTTIDRNPASWMAHNNLGNVLLQEGRTDEAIALFQQALQIKPDYADAYYNLGNALLHETKVDDAIALYRRALQLNPDYAKAHINLGNALILEGKMDEAMDHYQQALQITPNDAEAHIDLGNALLQKGKADEAIAHFRQALQINPDYAEACYDLGNALLQEGKTDEAMANYEQAVQVDPNYAEAQNNLGEVLLRKGSVDEAITRFQKAVDINPGYADAYFNLGVALSKTGNVDDAIVQYQKAVEINPAYLEAQINLGNALLQKGNTDEAIAHYQSALQSAQAAGRQDIVERLKTELKSLQGQTAIPSAK